MMDNSQDARGPTQRAVEIGVAALVALFALIVIAGSVQAGSGWGAEGPKAGFIPFYVGVLILVSSAMNFLHIGRDGGAGRLFAEWRQLAKVMAMWCRPRSTSRSFLDQDLRRRAPHRVFMRGLGRCEHGGRNRAGVPFVTFLVFEVVPPAFAEGPIEAYLGFEPDGWPGLR
jgi:hypothetical protein